MHLFDRVHFSINLFLEAHQPSTKNFVAPMQLSEQGDKVKKEYKNL